VVAGGRHGLGYDLVGVNWLEGGINLDKQLIDATAGLRKPLLSNGEKLHV